MIARRKLLWVLSVPLVLFCLLATTWAYGAIYFDGPLAIGRGNKVLAITWLVLTLTAVIVVKGLPKKGLALAVLFLVVLLPWLSIRPSNDRDWKPEWAQTGHVEIDGDQVTFHGLRNFDYGLDGSVTERWETRTVHLSNFQGMDFFLDKFGGDLYAHPIMSFNFGKDGFVTLSVETRREKGDRYSKYGGLYKMFDLQYLFGDERDFIRVRTNIRKSPVYLYRGKFGRERALEAFHESVQAANKLFEHPRFYNLFTHNCTTSLRAQRPAEKRTVFDIRMLANGKLDELIYERGGFETGGLPFPELRKQALINEAAQAAHDDAAFSRRIREGRPGFVNN